MKKSRITTFILIFAFLAGLCLVLYPKVSDYYNSFHQTRAIYRYISSLEELDEEDYEELLNAAKEHNRSLVQERRNQYKLTDEQFEQYLNLLTVSDDGIMGYIEIPVIGVSLPIYHGASDRVLQTAIGHLEWTSLPVGGESTHCVLTGHRGLPSSRLFTDLDRLVEGDVFMLRVLNETLTYEVDQILIVEPNETSQLQIVSGKDYCTLITCTPYGVNTHRILVRGHRIENEILSSAAHVTADAVPIEPLFVALMIFTVLVIVILLVVMHPRKKGTGPRE